MRADLATVSQLRIVALDGRALRLFDFMLNPDARSTTGAVETVGTVPWIAEQIGQKRLVRLVGHGS
jgi:hypothetical protein